MSTRGVCPTLSADHGAPLAWHPSAAEAGATRGGDNKGSWSRDLGGDGGSQSTGHTRCSGVARAEVEMWLAAGCNPAAAAQLRRAAQDRGGAAEDRGTGGRGIGDGTKDDGRRGESGSAARGVGRRLWEWGRRRTGAAGAYGSEVRVFLFI
jgi:hypothetical protein